jgi:Zn-dependent M16 (insulinase) family peptidase
MCRYFVEPSCLVVRGKPSASLADKLDKTEKARIAAQVKKLGPKGLAQAARELEVAKAEHEKPVPSEILTAFPVPDVRSISWIPVQSVQERGTGRTPTKRTASSELSKYIESDDSPLPFFVQFDHVKVRRRSCLSY